jgi:hemerythrin-like domain-containing protein
MERKVKDRSAETRAAAKERPTLYTPIHKGIRSRLFKTSMKAGRIDYTDQETVRGFRDEFISVVANIRHHHTLEEKFYHPLLSERVPGGAEKLLEDHHMVDHMLDNLVTHLEGIVSKPADFEKHGELGQEFYLAFNRFVAFFMTHINEEEEHIQPTLWDLCTFKELDTAEMTLIASQKPEEATENLEMILTSANLDDLADLLGRAKAHVPPEVAQGVFQLAERILDTRDWAALKSRIGIK